MQLRHLLASTGVLVVTSATASGLGAVSTLHGLRPFARASQTQTSGQDFTWHGRLAEGKTLEIKGVNGSVRATTASGTDAEVVAARRGRRNDPESVRIDVVEHAGGITICAVYPDSDGEHNTCEPGSSGHMKVNNNDVKVDFDVSVPAGVQFVGRTVNGDVSADSLKANTEAYTVNGSVRVITAGYAQAETVNGSITATLGRSNWTDTCEFRTVNGGITLDLPADLATLVRAETINGEISSDFPMTITGRFSPRRLRATIGPSDTTRRELELETVNGSIKLRRAP
jgi:DUF4097 and DUF4098 domain-containing protein YvlB